MGIMHWNKTAFIVHFGVKPQFRPVQASKKSMAEIKHAELYHSSHAFFFFFFGIALELELWFALLRPMDALFSFAETHPL